MLSDLLLTLLLLTAPPKPAPAPLRATVVDRAEQPVFVIAEGKAGARILLDGNTVPGLKEAAMTELIMLPGTVVPEHVHDTSAEMIYILEGRAQMTVDGVTKEVRAGMAILIPAGVKHALKMETKVEPLRALQVYTPGGPEQRFRTGEPARE